MATSLLLSPPPQDIYPKRIPSPIQRERRKHARELELFLRERYGQQRRRSEYRRNLIHHHQMATSASNQALSYFPGSGWQLPTLATRQRRRRRRRQRRLRDEINFLSRTIGLGREL